MAITTGVNAANPVVLIETNKGTVEVELFEDKAPITVKNFLAYTADKHYDGTIFHRVISDFMIQGGGFVPGMEQKKTKAAIKNESANGLLNARGTLAMARTPAADSATSQFFISLKDNKFLDRKDEDNVGYCVFGRVVKGMEVVDEIAKVATAKVGGHGDVPKEDILIKSVTVKK